MVSGQKPVVSDQKSCRRSKAGSKKEAREPEGVEDLTTSLISGDPELNTDYCSLTTALSGAEHLSRVVLVDQSPIGKTPRSTPAVYAGAFDAIRELFARSELARQHGLKASAFSFNSSQGQCERCRGAGFEKIEMQFLSDVYVRCPDCVPRHGSHSEIGLAANQEPAHQAIRRPSPSVAHPTRKSRKQQAAQRTSEMLAANVERRRFLTPPSMKGSISPVFRFSPGT